MPPGFQSLREITISMPDSPPDARYYKSLVELRALLVLPKLDLLHLDNIHALPGVHGFTLELQPRSVNVSNLYFRRTGLSSEEVWSLIQPIRALRSLTLEECPFPGAETTGITSLVERVVASHRQHLQSLTFPAQRIEFRDTSRFPLGQFSSVRNLKHITINIRDLEHLPNSFAWPEALEMPSLTFLELLGTHPLDATATSSLDATLAHAIESGLMPELRCVDPRKVQLPISRTNLGGGPMAGEFSSRREAFPLLCELGMKRGFVVLTSWEEDVRAFVPDLPRNTTQANIADYME
ncbi:hypothetical protein Tdes44962_MAKER04688 [Teratosphaeria destructans]|uniref:Uncharacterized protein n=1 Tax=Teratosphaeria destructans TaxID=418781 RepID=A0A9W7SM72_9PEZI|nr:hypothetical protein Tdes44962_MAKER04688 [Teratosphaeria destructans]